MSDIPVTELFLFNHGMGFLIRSMTSKIESKNTKNNLMFKVKEQEINDVLKSLLTNIQDCIITDINYTTPVKEEVNVDLSMEETLSSFFEKNKGQKLEVLLDDKTEFNGRILLLQKEIEYTHEPKTLVLMTEKGIKRIQVNNIQQIKLLDQKLLTDLKKVITNYVWEKDKEREIVIAYQPVKENLTSTNIMLGYLIQMPIWKVSYRLRIISENEIRLSGWCIVENETSDDWNNISLKLISGNPISFIYDLESQINLSRSDFTPLPPKASGPIIAQASLSSEGPMDDRPRPPPSPAPMMKSKSARRSMMTLGSEPRLEALAGPGGGMMMDFEETMAEDVDEYFEKEANAKTMTEMIGAIQETDKEVKSGSDYYVFSITSKITIPGKEKSIIPLINEKVDAKKILWHKNTIENPSPYQAIELVNNTEFPFEHGPVMLFSESMPIGQGILEKTNVGDKKIIPYALEDRVRIQYKLNVTKYSEYTFDFQPDRKIIIQRRFKYVTVEIRIINFLSEKKILLSDYYPIEDLDLITESQKDLKIEKNEKYFRFALDLKEKSIKKYLIEFKKELVSSVNFDSIDKKFVLEIPDSKMDKQIKDKLVSFIEYQNKKRQFESEISRINQRMNTIESDETRLQKNIQSLSVRKEDDRTRNSFITKLEELFEEYITLQIEKDNFQLQIKNLQDTLDNLIIDMKNIS